MITVAEKREAKILLGPNRRDRCESSMAGYKEGFEKQEIRY